MICIRSLLPRLLSDDSYTYIPNSGNLGDALLASSTRQILDGMGLVQTSNASTILVAGGGGLREGYFCLARKMSQLSRSKRVIILPSTISGYWSFLRQFQNLTVLAREDATQAFCGTNGINVTLCQDLALSVDLSSIPHVGGKGELIAFRTDAEKSHNPPAGNRALSLERTGLWELGSSDTAARWFVQEIAQYDSIRTNFTHIAIVAAKLGIPCQFSPGSYFKNEAMFESSLSQFPNISFVG